MKKILVTIWAVTLTAALFGIAIGQPEVNKIKHPTNPHSPKFDGYALTTGGTGNLSALIDHGGALIGTPTIYLIWYGNWNQNNGTKGDTPQGQALIRQWAQDIGGSPYYQLNKSLSRSGGTTISGNANYGGEATATGTSTRLSDLDIQNIVKNTISAGKLPYLSSGVYFVITSSNVTARSGFCTQYCGWHTSTTYSGSNRLRYSFVGNASRCLSSCAAQSNSPNGLPGIDGAISVLSHELEEANTDPDLNAWYDSSGAENADKCAWTFGHAQFAAPNGSWANMILNGHYYLIQRNILKSNNAFTCMVNSTQN
jgi:hypothetical protein